MQTLEKQIETKRGNPNWTRGVSGNPAGRPINPEKRQLENALRSASRKHNNVEFLHHIADLAYTDKSVGLAVLDKLVPDNKLPEQKDEQAQQPKFILVFNDGNTNNFKAIPAEVHPKPQEIPRDVLFMGHGKDDVSDSQGHDIHGTVTQQSGGDLSQGVHRSEELDSTGLREVLRLQGGQQPDGNEPND